MEIGLDYDGVIADPSKVKSELAKKMYNINIHPSMFKRELVVPKLLTEQQYRQVQNEVYENKDLCLSLPPVPGALDYLPRLLRELHMITIITSRYNNSADTAQEWLVKNNLFVPVIGVPYPLPKTDACKGLDVYVDDDLDKLEPLVSIVENRYLFSQPYNKHNNPGDMAKRVDSWQQLYFEIQRLNK